jgi:DnaK suppressor protein
MAKSSAKKIAKPVSKKSAPAKVAAKKPAAKLVKKAAPAVKSSAKTKPAAKSTAKPVAKAAAKPVVAAKPKRDYKPAKLPAGYKPTASETYMNPQQEEYFRQKLLAWRKELMDESRETLDHLHEENWHQADIADRASLETEAGVELRTRNRYLKLISKIDSAIARIEQGDYGYCEETGEPIGLKRLEARPVATLSIEAQERHEKIEKQYTDED